MTTAHFVMQVIAFITLGLSSMFWMFAKVTFTGPASALAKLLIRTMGFLGAVWLILEILKVQY